MSPTNHLSESLKARISKLIEIDRPRFARLWMYHRNPMTPLAVDADDSGRGRPYRQAQEWGMPSRLTGVRSSIGTMIGTPIDDVQRKEIVIENDIGWRIDAMVDALFGKAIVINSAAPDPARRAILEQLLRKILANHGGVVFLQQIALMGCVYGFVDVLVKFDPPHANELSNLQSSNNTQSLGDAPAAHEPSADLTSPHNAEIASVHGDVSNPAASDNDLRDAWITRLAAMVRLELVEPTRALPLLDPNDYRTIEAYGQVYEIKDAGFGVQGSEKKPGWIEKLFPRAATQRVARLVSSDSTQILDLITPTEWKRFENEKLVSSGANSLGQIPLVHIQNIPLPCEYAGASDVEPLIPMQDELNTRLSDRANRIAMQSFKMYLGKGIEQFNDLPVAPGRMWMTDNENAQIIEFGGDANCPSERDHIADVREAMDKISCVTPIAAGAIKGRIGQLTSAAALKITLMALISRTEKKRLSYGAGIARMCELALARLDCAGVLHTSPDKRRIEIHWSDPLPQNDAEQLQQAESKLRLGVAKEIVLRELGY